MESDRNTPNQEKQNKSYDFREVNRFFDKIVNLSDTTVDIFLKSYVKVFRGTADLQDRELKLKSLLDFISSIRHGYFNLYKFPEWGKGETEEVSPNVKKIIDNVIGITRPIMDRGLLDELEKLSNESLSLLRHDILGFLRSLTFMNRDYAPKLSRQEKRELFLEMYLKALTNQNHDYKESQSFHVAIGIFLYIEVERFERMTTENKIIPQDVRTQASAPFIYIAFELARRNDNTKIQNLVLSLLKRACDITTKGIYHPDDPEYTRGSTKFSDKDRTEAEGLFDELFTELLIRQNLPKLTYEKLFEKVYEYSQELAYLPASYRRDLVNIIESYQAKSTGLTIKDLRATRQEQDEYGESPYEVPEQSNSIYQREIPVSHTEPEYVEGNPTEYCPPDITYPTQYSYREYTETKDSVITLFKRELEQLPKNATKKKRVCEIVIEELESRDPNLDFKNLSERAEATERTVKNLFKDLLDKNPWIEDFTSSD